VADELTLVEPYLSIMRARFGPRLAVTADVTAEARACLLPSLLLISPVENAIKHDVAMTSAQVSISVRGWVAQGLLHLSVANSGATPERTHREGAIGLANTRQRLQALYGDAAALHLGPGPGGGGLLSIQLPARR
jgi:LytS/YehU family sensor histidine kinase